MSMYTQGKEALEPDDLAAVFSDGVIVTLLDGRQGLLVCLVLKDTVGKQYAPGEFPKGLHLANGVRDWRLPIAPMPALDAPAVVESAPGEPPAPPEPGPVPAPPAPPEPAPGPGVEPALAPAPVSPSKATAAPSNG